MLSGCCRGVNDADYTEGDAYVDNAASHINVTVDVTGVSHAGRANGAGSALENVLQLSPVH